MIAIELDDDTYAVVFNAVEAMARQSRAQYESLGDEYVLHRHHQRLTAAAARPSYGRSPPTPSASTRPP